MLSAASFFLLLTCLYAYCPKADLHLKRISDGQDPPKAHVMNLSSSDKLLIWICIENAPNKFGAIKVKVFKHIPSDLIGPESNVIRFEFEDSNAEMDGYISKLVKLEWPKIRLRNGDNISTIEASLYPDNT